MTARARALLRWRQELALRTSLIVALLVLSAVGWPLLTRVEGCGGASSAEIEGLRAELARERAARALLASQVARLEHGVAALRERADPLSARVFDTDAHPSEDAPALADPARAHEGASGADAGRAFFDEQRLAAAGLPERDLTELRQLFEETELTRLDLRDRAARESWPPARLASETAALEQRLRALGQEHGEATYDWFLYATGRPNRVIVLSVLGRSAADASGVRTGDVLYAYGGQRLFDPEELVQSTHEGRLNERVELELGRAGERVRVSVPRGPLGVKVAGKSLSPASAPER